MDMNARRAKTFVFSLRRRFNHSVDFGLNNPNANREEPKQEKLSGKVGEGDFPLQLDCLKGFGDKIQGIENAKHGKKVQRQNNRHKQPDQPKVQVG